MTIEAARAAAADRYADHIEDTMGRQHECIPRRAILSGQWDAGSLVRGELARIEGEKRT